PAQPGIAEMPDKRKREITERQGARPEMPRLREVAPDDERAGEAEEPDGGEGDAPGAVIGDDAGGEPPGHAAEPVAGDEQPDREADGARIGLLAEIGHGDGRQPAQRDALERA